MPPLTQADTERSLVAMAQDFSAYSREHMLRTGTPVMPMAIVTTPESLAVLTVLDQQRHLSMFREAVQSLSATGLVFVYDGWTTVGDAARTDALMIVWASQWGLAGGEAFRYEKTPFGIRFLDALPASPEHLSPYLRVFDRPEPHI